MKAVCTILGWCTAAAAAAGAAMLPVCCASDLGVLVSSLEPFPSLSGLLVADAGADELVGVVMSMGSPGDGADIWMVGVRMGMVRTVIGSSGPSAMMGGRCALSVAAAIGSAARSGQRRREFALPFRNGGGGRDPMRAVAAPDGESATNLILFPQ